MFMSIIIGADCVPTGNNEDKFISGKIDDMLSSNVVEVLKNADFRLVNLEMPLTESNNKISKCGPALKASPLAINGYLNMRINAVTLANNHIMDYGSDGVRETIDILNANGIEYLGVGSCKKDARKPLYKVINGKIICFYACVEHEFSSAGENKWGANTFDGYDTYSGIYSACKNSDYTIVLYHGGKEEYRFPSPELQKRCKNMIDCGADLILCQHSHCIGCYEVYKNKKIVYGQGNFIFDLCDDEYWNSGMFVQINDDFTVDLLPFIKKNNMITLAEGEERTELLALLYTRNQLLAETSEISKQFIKLSSEQIYSYMYKISGVDRSLMFRILNKVSGYRFGRFYIKKRYNKQDMLNLLNYIECESHREIVITGLKSLIEEA